MILRKDSLDIDPFRDQLWPVDFDQADVVGPGLKTKPLKQISVQPCRFAHRGFAGIAPADFNNRRMIVEIHFILF
jgi:hypothetical protein